MISVFSPLLSRVEQSPKLSTTVITGINKEHDGQRTEEEASDKEEASEEEEASEKEETSEEEVNSEEEGASE